MGGDGKALVQGNGRPSRNEGVSARGCAYGAGKEYLKASRRAFWLGIGMGAMSGIIGPTILGPIVAGTQIAWNLLVVFLVLFVVLLSVVIFIMGRRPPGDR